MFKRSSTRLHHVQIVATRLVYHPTVRLIPPEPHKLYSTDEKEAKYKKLIHHTLQ
ncbi:hypothetical protein Tco_0453965, partial [Tanacetum coccineum]